jgi:hypothetical protein
LTEMQATILLETNIDVLKETQQEMLLYANDKAKFMQEKHLGEIKEEKEDEQNDDIDEAKSIVSCHLPKLDSILI